MTPGRILSIGAVAMTMAAAAVPAQSPSDDSSFVLSSDDPARTPSPFIGNGRIGLVIPALGIGPAPSYHSGLYEEFRGDVPRIVQLPAWTLLRICRTAGCLDSAVVGAGQVQGYHQALDLRSGTVRTQYDWMTGEDSASLRIESFVSRADSRVGATRLELTPARAGRYRLGFALAGRPPPRRLALGRIERADPAWRPADIWYPGHMIVRSRQVSLEPTGARLALAATSVGRTTRLRLTARVDWPASLRHPSVRRVATGDSALVELAFDAEAGRRYVFTQIVSMALPGEPEDRVEGPWDRLAAANDEAWARRWTTDILIEGSPELQRVVRSMLFNLLASADSGTGLGVPPMGLSSGGYYGHIFWDSDTWMFPSLLLTHPDIARSLVDFRHRTLPAARENARSNGYRGAMYPWEADERGRETTPHFAVQNARSEIHVNGDVALAQWQYYLATGDSAWLARVGYPVIRATADFWLSRAVYDSAGGRYHIRNVVSVAEGLIGISDDAYTNAVAQKNLQIAAAAAAKLGLPADSQWSRVAEKLHLPYDSASQFFRTYEGAPDSTLGMVTPLLSYPLGVPMSPRAKRTQLEQAVERLLQEGPGAMMGSTLLSVDAAELGERALLDSLLPHSYQRHLKGPFLMLSETPTNDAVNFVTGAGGFLQQVIYGYTGLRLGERGLEPEFPALLPSRISRLALRNVSLRGRRYDIVVDSAGRHMISRDSVPR